MRTSHDELTEQRVATPSLTQRERAASRPRPAYLPIADHGVIGDLRSVALVGVDGTIDWYCCPRFDAPNVFGAILDCVERGHCRIAPIGEFSTRQMYMPDTNVLITRFLSAAGVGEVQDFMVVDDGPQRLARRVSCISGSLRFRLECEPRFNYGRDRHDVSLATGNACSHRPSLPWRSTDLRRSCPPRVES